jgi:DNA-binding transcriptional LysR family regulator
MSAAKLRAFLSVAEHGSFSAAARAVALSQPTLTTQVQALERQHNVVLFHRQGHRIELTSVGERLLPIARQIAALELTRTTCCTTAATCSRASSGWAPSGPST